MIIYIAGKYSAATWTEKTINTYKAMDAGIRILLKGHYALIPHLTHFLDERMDALGLEPRDKNFWYAFDNQIIPKCEGFIKLSKDGESMGADMEEQLAIGKGLKIFKTLDEIPTV